MSTNSTDHACFSLFFRIFFLDKSLIIGYLMNPLYEENQRRFTEPCIVVIFGATGDLTSRKLVPPSITSSKKASSPRSLPASDLQDALKPTKSSAKRWKRPSKSFRARSRLTNRSGSILKTISTTICRNSTMKKGMRN